MTQTITTSVRSVHAADLSLVPGVFSLKGGSGIGASENVNYRGERGHPPPDRVLLLWFGNNRVVRRNRKQGET